MSIPILSSSKGHSSLTVLICIIIISTLFLMASSLLRQNMFESQSMRREWKNLIMKEKILTRVIEELEGDPTPESHSSKDPVWDYVASCQSGETRVELRDLSSRLNPNFMRTKLFEETGLRDLIINGDRPDRIRDIRTEQGFCTDLDFWRNTFGEENLSRFFTLHSWANINVTYEESLESLYRVRKGNGGAIPFRSRIQEGLREKKLWRIEELRQLMGLSAESLYPVINCLPLMNIHHMEPLLLECLLAYPYGGEILENHEALSHLLIDRSKSGEISPLELRALINPSEEQLRVLEYLGTKTWFWELTVSIGEKDYHSIIASYGEGWFVIE
jgi:hypothetical protein